ncbi:MAG: hypothetical protein Q8R36_02345 [bacterium]|nr:hypothetical protein [bacterium]
MNDNEFTQNQNPTETQNVQQTENFGNTPEKKIQVGPIIGSIIIVILLILGGLYFIGKRVSGEDPLAPEPQAILNTTDPSLQALEEPGFTDEIDSIQNDLSATNLDELDAELGNIEVELGF